MLFPYRCIFAVLRANIRIIFEVHKFVVHKLVYQMGF